MRLDKFLASSGIGSRSDVKKHIASGFIFVNGSVVKDSGLQVKPDDEITFKGESISYKENLTYVFDKPDNVVTAMEDKRLPNVGDFIPETLKNKGLSPVGRLDYHSTGLLIITNDGELSHRITSPKYHLEKTYRVSFEGSQISSDDITLFASGMTLTDMKDPVKLKPAELKPLSDNECLITIKEGKTHQIRRMMASINKPVITLRRISIGSLKLDDNSNPGDFKEVSADDLLKIKKELQMDIPKEP